MGKRGSWLFPSVSLRLQRFAISTAFASASGHVLEKLRHFRLRLEVLIAAEALRTALVGEHVAFGDAHARFVRAEIVGLHELDRMRRNRRELHLRGKLKRSLDVRFNGQACRAGRHAAAQPLQLDVVAPGKELGPLVRERLREPHVVHEQRLSDVAVVRAGERDQSFGACFGEPALEELRAAAIAVRAVSARQELAEPQVTGLALTQKEQPERLVAVGLVRDPDVTAGDRLYAARARGIVKLDQSKNVAEIGQCQRGHAIRDRGVDRLVQAHDAVYDRVFAVQSEVDERRLAHAGILTVRCFLLRSSAAPQGT